METWVSNNSFNLASYGSALTSLNLGLDADALSRRQKLLLLKCSQSILIFHSLTEMSKPTINPQELIVSKFIIQIDMNSCLNMWKQNPCFSNQVGILSPITIV